MTAPKHGRWLDLRTKEDKYLDEVRDDHENFLCDPGDCIFCQEEEEREKERAEGET